MTSVGPKRNHGTSRKTNSTSTESGGRSRISLAKAVPNTIKAGPKRTNKVAKPLVNKTAKILDLLKRPEGSTLKELCKATGWQPHSIRGFLSGVVTRRLGLRLSSIKAETGERRYSTKVKP